MKFSSRILMALILLPWFSACTAQINNAKTDTVRIYGNCGMCESTIEKAGNQKGVSKVDWDRDTKMATLTYDAKMTNQSEILKRIALAGYDSDSFLAPDDVYASLPDCCQYERAKKAPEMTMQEMPEMTMQEMPVKAESPGLEKNGDTQTNKPPIKKEVTVQAQEVNALSAVFTAYFGVKDALVQTDAKLTAAKGDVLSSAINAVQMKELPMDVHMIWMKKMDELKQDVNAITKSTDVESQRSHFINVSNTMYELIKVAKYETPVYYQFCPMANDGNGANWLSKEKVVKNPYYGSMMLSCGKVVETIK